MPSCAVEARELRILSSSLKCKLVSPINVPKGDWKVEVRQGCLQAAVGIAGTTSVQSQLGGGCEAVFVVVQVDS